MSTTTWTWSSSPALDVKHPGARTESSSSCGRSYIRQRPYPTHDCPSVAARTPEVWVQQGTLLLLPDPPRPPPVLDPQQLALNPQQLEPDPQQSVLDPQQLVLDPQQVVQNSQHLMLDPQQLVLGPQQIVLDPQRLVLESQQLSLDLQQFVHDPQPPQVRWPSRCFLSLMW